MAMTAWLRVELSEEQQRVVNAERDEHPCQHVRRKMLVLWLLHHGITRERAASVAGLGRATVQRYVAAFRESGLDGLRAWGNEGPISDLAAHAEAIKQEFTQRPVRSTAEACERIERLTGVRRQPTQVRKFLKGLGLRWRRVRAIPVPPKKVSTSTSRGRPSSSRAN
jgi:transposase